MSPANPKNATRVQPLRSSLKGYRNTAQGCRSEAQATLGKAMKSTRALKGHWNGSAFSGALSGHEPICRVRPRVGRCTANPGLYSLAPLGHRRESIVASRCSVLSAPLWFICLVFALNSATNCFADLTMRRVEIAPPAKIGRAHV